MIDNCTRDKGLQSMEIRIIFLSIRLYRINNYNWIFHFVVFHFASARVNVKISCFRGRGSWRG